MDGQVLFAGVAVSSLEEVRPWYERFFGRDPDIVPNESEVMWRVAASSAWLYLVVDGERAGKALVALAVPDLNAELETLGSRGIAPVVVEQVGEAGRKATLRDPDGNTIALIEVAA